MLTGNKGEWSEIYTLLKILADRELYAGDSELKRIEGLFYPIVKILREESNGTYEYSYESDLVIVKGNDEEFRIPIQIFQDQAVNLLRKIKEINPTTFSIAEIETFINTFNCVSLKAKSSVKSDIRIVIHDFRTGAKPELGFSIKSQLGGASTLLNAGKATNFIYRIEGSYLSEHQIEEVNSINSKSKIKDRITRIQSFSGSLRFKSTETLVFSSNLTLVDSFLPNILAEIIYLYYTSNFSRTVDLIKEVSRINPLNYNLQNYHPYYLYKVKRFLTDVALGMLPSKVWTGELDATGGYLVVKEDGEVLCYHIYNRNEFEDYLINNTKLDTPGSKKHGFGVVYTENGEQFFKLNLQIRFIK